MMKLFKNKKAQNVAEYAILIALVVGAIIAIQTFAKRALQARVRDASQYMTTTMDFDGLGGQTYNTAQYEPYYLQSESNTVKSETEMKSGSATQQGLALNASTNTTGTQNAVIQPGQQIGGGLTF